MHAYTHNHGEQSACIALPDHLLKRYAICVSFTRLLFAAIGIFPQGINIQVYRPSHALCTHRIC